MADFTSNTSVIYKLRLTVNVTSQNVANNTSTLNWSLALIADGSSSYSISCGSGVSPFNVEIAGQKVVNAYSPALSIRGGQTVGIKSGSLTVQHDSNGSKSIDVKASYAFGISGSYSPGTLSLSGSMALPALARTSSVSLSKKDYTMGENMTITIGSSNSGFTHTLRVSWFGGDPGGTNADIVSKTSSTSYSWTVPLTLANALPNSTSGWGTIFCDTYSGSTLVGTSSATFTATVPSNVKPEISSLTIGEATADLATKFQAYIQSKSTLAVSATATGKYNSTITSIVTTIEGRSYTGTSFTSGVLQGSGTIPVTTTVTDSRGRSVSETVNASVLPYSPPQLTRSDLDRYTGSEPDPDGTKLHIDWAYSISSLNDKNTVAFFIYWDKPDGTSVQLVQRTSGYTNSVSQTLSQTFDPDASHSIRFFLKDAFSTVTITKTLPTAFVILDAGLNGKSLAVGKVSSDGGRFEVGIPSEFDHNIWAKGDLTVSGEIKGGFGDTLKKAVRDLVYPVGSVIILQSGKDPNTLIGGTWSSKYFQIVAGNDKNFVVTTNGNSYSNGNNVQLYSVTSQSASSAWRLAAVEQNGSTSGRSELVPWMRTA